MSPDPLGVASERTSLGQGLGWCLPYCISGRRLWGRYTGSSPWRVEDLPYILPCSGGPLRVSTGPLLGSSKKWRDYTLTNEKMEDEIL